MISGLPVSRLKALLVALLLVLAPLAALAQTSPDAPRTETTESSTTSQGLDAAVSSALSAASGAIEGASGGVGQSSILLFLGLTVLSLAPAIAITVTCFPFMVTVLSILRQSIGGHGLQRQLELGIGRLAVLVVVRLPDADDRDTALQCALGHRWDRIRQ